MLPKTFWWRNKSVQGFSPLSIYFIDLFHHACNSACLLQHQINIPTIIFLLPLNNASFSNAKMYVRQTLKKLYIDLSSYQYAFFTQTCNFNTLELIFSDYRRALIL